MDSLMLAILVVVALVIGLAIGWMLGARPVADWRARADGHEATIKAMTVDLAGLSERVRQIDALSAELASVRADRDALSPRLATAEARAADAERLRAELAETRTSRDALSIELERKKADAAHFEEQKRLLADSEERLRKEFENAGSKVLAQAQEAFLTRAQARFEESEKAQSERLNTLLAPVDTRLKEYTERVEKLDKERVDSFGQLTGLINSVQKGQEAVRAEAAKLGNSLRSGPKTRGNWGEMQLRNVLEQCGLSEYTDFETEVSINTEDGRLRPDAKINLPGGKILIVDAKVSINDYQDAIDSDSEIARKISLDKHVSSMRNHIMRLSEKSYQSQFPNTPDYVIMFVPGEHFISAGLENDPTLWKFAFERKILLASPTNLVALARTVAHVWQQDGLTREAQEIAKLAAGLYDSLAKTQDDLSKLGGHLGRAVNSFNDFARTYDGNVLGRAKRLTEKHIKGSKREISDDVPVIESIPRYGAADADTASLPSAATAALDGADL